MPSLVSGEYRVCADCYGPMKKMPGLNDIWMCEACLGVNYRLPAEWEMDEDTEEQQDEALYRVEVSGE